MNITACNKQPDVLALKRHMQQVETDSSVTVISTVMLANLHSHLLHCCMLLLACMLLCATTQRVVREALLALRDISVDIDNAMRTTTTPTITTGQSTQVCTHLLTCIHYIYYIMVL
jgi:hypothetical protein